MARCLIADVDRERRASLRLRLERAGYAVREVEDGETCLAILHASSVDVLVVDLGLVRPTSIDLIREAKRQLPSFRIVAVTDASHPSGDGTVGEALAAGAVLMIQKPFSFAHLLLVGKFVAARAL
ncbi:MAG: response regulator [Nitrospira sp.]|nr:response regulator [Nitrospira sp.]MCS6317582.1 response regulator [Nitrospira sp.]